MPFAAGATGRPAAISGSSRNASSSARTLESETRSTSSRICATARPSPWEVCGRSAAWAGALAPFSGRGGGGRLEGELGGVDRLWIQPLHRVHQHLGLVVEGDHASLDQDVVARGEGGLEGVHVVEDAPVDLAGLVGEDQRHEGLAAAPGDLRLLGDPEDGVQPLLLPQVFHVHLADGLGGLLGSGGGGRGRRGFGLEVWRIHGRGHYRRTRKMRGLWRPCSACPCSCSPRPLTPAQAGSRPPVTMGSPSMPARSRARASTR